MDSTTRRRLSVIHDHFNTSLHLPQQQDSGSTSSFDTTALQHLLDHDNHAQRAAMKQLMASNDVFLMYDIRFVTTHQPIPVVQAV